MSVMRDRKAFDADDLRRQIKALGPRLGPPVLAPCQAMFGPLHPAPPYPGVTVTRDHRYGPHERHRLDVFRGDGAANAPVLLFVHGGGFTGGDKKLPVQPFYDNIGVWAARSGMVAVTMTYRLAPQHQWPAGAEDIARAIVWIKVNIAGPGGDPARVFLMGHSAGAAHAAAYAAQPRFHANGEHGLAGLVVVAGLYDIPRCERSPIIESYYGTKPEIYAERSSLPQIRSVKVPVLIAVGEHEAPDFERQALALLQAVYERDGRLPRFARLDGQNHYSEIFAFGLDYCPELARHIREFIQVDCA